MLWLTILFPTLPLDIYTRGQHHNTLESEPLTSKPKKSETQKTKLQKTKPQKAKPQKASARVQEEQANYTSHTPTQSIIIVEKNRVLMGNDASAQLGIKSGMPLSTVYVLSNNIKTIERNTEKETSALIQLGQWGYQFTPYTTLHEPNCLLMEIGGCLTLFGGLQKILEQISTSLKEQGYHYQFGLAHTPKAAIALAHQHIDINYFNPATQSLIQPPLEQALKNIAIENLDIASKELVKLQQLGLDTLGDILKLPSYAIGKRFGKKFSLYLQQLIGDQHDPQQPIIAKESFRSSFHYVDGIGTTQMLLFPMQRLLKELSNFMLIRQLHCRNITWKLLTHQQHCETLPLEFARPQNDFKNALDLTRLKLEGFKIRESIETITLITDQFSELETKNQTLFKELDVNLESNTNQAKLIDKLSARLGGNVFHGIKKNDEYLPELAWKETHGPQLLDIDKNLTLEKKSKVPNRPFWLLKKPPHIQKRQQKLYWQGTLTLLNGPERIDNHWWQKHNQRDYFVARHENGSLYWVYRDLQEDTWFLQGVFG